MPALCTYPVGIYDKREDVSRRTRDESDSHLTKEYELNLYTTSTKCIPGPIPSIPTTFSQLELYTQSLEACFYGLDSVPNSGCAACARAAFKVLRQPGHGVEFPNNFEVSMSARQHRGGTVDERFDVGCGFDMLSKSCRILERATLARAKRAAVGGILGDEHAPVREAAACRGQASIRRRAE